MNECKHGQLAPAYGGDCSECKIEELTMSEEKSLQQVIEAAVTAENAGVAVDWKALCFQTYNVAMEEIRNLNLKFNDIAPEGEGDGTSAD